MIWQGEEVLRSCGLAVLQSFNIITNFYNHNDIDALNDLKKSGSELSCRLKRKPTKSREYSESGSCIPLGGTASSLKATRQGPSRLILCFLDLQDCKTGKTCKTTFI